MLKVSDKSKVTCPYRLMPETSFWRKSIANERIGDVDPVVSPKFSISLADRIVTAGSCFAQHIARYLQDSGYHYLVVEDMPPFVPENIRSTWNYGTFSARYGNIYTTRQLVQLLQRAYGTFIPLEDFWQEKDHFIDPFRPYIQPKGFPSVSHLRRDREQHLRAVRRLVETANVFIFTLGLTEAWRDRRDGAVYPVCPGCGVGRFEGDVHEFKNFSYMEVYADIAEFLTCLRAVNPLVKVVLTVSPVPLVATASGNHVLSATTYSKSVLRAVAGAVSEEYDFVEYFPSFEVISSSYNLGTYYEDDLRTIKATGVDHVMRLFLKHYCDRDAAAARMTTARTRKRSSSGEISGQLRVICEEEKLDAALG